MLNYSLSCNLMEFLGLPIWQANHGVGGGEINGSLDGEERVYGWRKDLLLSWTPQSSPQVHHLVRWRRSRYRLFRLVQCVSSCAALTWTFCVFKGSYTFWPHRTPVPCLLLELFSNSWTPPGVVSDTAYIKTCAGKVTFITYQVLNVKILFV